MTDTAYCTQSRHTAKRAKSPESDILRTGAVCALRSRSMMHEVQGLRSGPISDEFRLLLVQPESERRACYAAALVGAGFAVKVADDGLQAASDAPSWKPAIVVTDLVLPGLTGLELCCRLREDEA